MRRAAPQLSRSTSDFSETELENRKIQDRVSSQSLPLSQPDLLKISPSQDLIFSPNSYDDLTARIEITNVSTGSVAYKMKTTTPERFKVRPSSGSLRSGESSMMDIMVTKSHKSANIGVESVIRITLTF